MIKLVIVKNPFKPNEGRIIKDIPYGLTAKEITKEAGFDGLEINCIVNGETVEMAEDYIVPDNQMVVLSPVIGKSRGGKILGMVVGVALMVVGGMAAAGKIALMAAAGTSVAVGAGIAVGLVGSFLMSYSQSAYAKSIGAPKFETSTNDATYSWSGVHTMEGQNNPITLTYGKVKSGGQSIGKYITTADNKQYLNWLVSAGEGELTFSDIMLNDNDISYYDSIELETRPGTNDQEIIPYFNDTYASKSLGYQLLDGYRTESCQGNAVQGFKFEIEFSNGLYYANDKGGLSEAWVDVYAEYRRNDGEWTPVFEQIAYELPDGITISGNPPIGKYKAIAIHLNDRLNFTIIYPNGKQERNVLGSGEIKIIGDFTVNESKISADNNEYEFGINEKYSGHIAAAQSSALRKEYRIDNLPEGEYEVRIKVTGRSHEINNSRASVRCYWSDLTSIVYDDFAYPGIALIGIRALATDQISGSPNLTFIKERPYVWVYNPVTEEYEQKPSDNPAWASYDMLHLASRLKNINTGEYEYECRGVPAKHIMYEQFKEWADFCDAKNFKVNIEITQNGEMLETINGQVALIGRGLVLRFGTRYGCIWDSIKQPVQMFGMGNIVEGTMQEEFLATNDRANGVEISFNNAEHNYERETITIYSDNYDSDAEEKITQVTYNGITSYEQAYREGKYQLYCNKYLIRTVSFDANIDAIACTIGDVVLVSHDVPQWAYSGRIYSVDVENNTMRLPIEIKNASGNYRIMYRTEKDILHSCGVTIIENADGWCMIRCNDTFDPNDLPQANDVFDVALSNVGSKPFVVKSITRASDFTRKISCIEYNENVYNENYEIPPMDYRLDSDNVAKNVTKLNATQISYKDETLASRSRLEVSWVSPDNGGTFAVFYSEDKEKWNLLQSNISGNNCFADIGYGKSYYVKVVTTLGVSKSSGAVTDIIPIGEDLIPPNVKQLDVEILKDGTRRYFWDFDYPVPNDIAGFKMKYLQGNYANWEMGYDVQDGLILSQPYETTTVRQGAHVVMIKAVDNAGNESERAAICIADFGDPLEDNVLYRHVFSTNRWAECETDGVILDDGNVRSRQTSYHWGNPNGNYWSSPADNFWEESYDTFYLEASLTAPASGYFYLLYDIDGICNLTYKNNSTDNLFKPYSTKIAVNAGDVITIRFDSPEGNTRTILKELIAIIDVPDRVEHFENIEISAEGTTLPIKTPNFKTVAINVDAISTNVAGQYDLVKVSDNPCIIRIERVNNDAAMTRTPINVIADITWQGFEKEII